ncbi:MAG: hypothetical protein KBD53_02775 [Candidatus Omnitrophica bacterium]|nr:hypothetical protein [Candidatus Omnitrophota bacterium]
MYKIIMNKKLVLLLFMALFATSKADAQTLHNACLNIKNISSNITSDTALCRSHSPYTVTGDISVLNGAKLKIHPGVVVKFKAGASLSIGNGDNSTGILLAQGTEAEPILFTSELRNPAPGDWDQIRITTTGTEKVILDHIIVEYAGKDALEAFDISTPWNSDGTIKHFAVTNSIFRNNHGNGLLINNQDSYNAPVIENNTFENNTSYPIKIAGDYILPPLLRNNTYLGEGTRGQGSGQGILIDSYILGSPGGQTLRFLNDNTYYVAEGPKIILQLLIIEPGVVIKFGPNAGIQLGDQVQFGALVARGTPSQPIIFTSNLENPVPGSWGSIYAYRLNSSDAQLDNVIIEYGGNSSQNAVCTFRGMPSTFTNSTIRYNLKKGVQKLSIGGAPGLLSGNNFSDNITGGFENNHPWLAHAENNWWGDASGPSGNGPGSGQSVTGNVEFEPWRGEPADSSFTFYDVSVQPKTFNQNGGSVTISAKLTESVNWEIIIRDGTDAIVRTFAGTGTEINQNWTGDDNFFLPLPNGVYKYTISAVSDENPKNIITLIGRLTLDGSTPLAKINEPEPFLMVSSGQQVQIFGTAAGSNFNSYVLEYGNGYSPAGWTTFQSSTSMVNNGLLGTWDIPPSLVEAATIRLRVTNNSSVTSIHEFPVKVLSVFTGDNINTSPSDEDVSEDTSKMLDMDSIFSLDKESYMPEPLSSDANMAKDNTISATITYESNWTLIIKDSFGSTVRSYKGTGTVIDQRWDGKNDEGVIQPDGDYTYEIEAVEPKTGISAVSSGQVTKTENVK